jgi:NTE family protein
MTSTPSVALALGGGGARGLAHIHVIETLDELGITPVAISGSSIGAIMGAAVAAGMTGGEIRDYAAQLLSSKAEVASRVWRAQPMKLAKLMDNGFHLGGFNAEAILHEFLPGDIPETFAQLRIPLHVTGTDFYGHKLAVLNSGDLVSAIAGSIALPAVFRPVQREGITLIDGGLYNPVPYDVLEGMADIIVAVDVVGVPGPSNRAMPTTMEVLFGTSQLMMHSIMEMKLQSSQPDILLRPTVGQFRVLDFLRMETIMQQTAPIRDELKRELDAAFAARMA